MDTLVIILIVVAVVVVVAALAWVLVKRRAAKGPDPDHLKQRFGEEYDRTVEARGKRAGERELAERERHHDSLDIRPLGDEARKRYQQAWWETQERFVDEPAAAVGKADSLVTDVLRDRGYSVSDFDHRASDVSVDHPEVMPRYRSAHEIALKNENGEASTEELRDAMTHYRALFDRLVEDGAGHSEPGSRDGNEPRAGQEQQAPGG